MKNKVLICLAAFIICLSVLLLNIAELPEFGRNEFPPAESTVQETDATGRININKATAEELTALYGVGEVRAKAIIEYREFNGGFISAEELINIDGINQSVLNRNADIITF